MATDRPNILLIVADDLGIDTFHIDDATDEATVQVAGTGAYPLPTLSRLVEKGIHFTRAWAHPICAPTRATLFTGLNPWQTTIGDAAAIPEPILPLQLPTAEAPTIRTLANAVADAGYQCAIFGKWDLGADHDTFVPTARGWHRHEGILAGGLRFIDANPPRRQEYEEIIQQDVRYVSWEKVIGDACIGTVLENITPEQRTHKYATADQVFGVRNWIKHVNGNPWWVTLSLFSPHDPFHVPPKDTFTIQFKDPANPTIQEMFVAMMESLDHYLGEFFNDPDPEVREQLKNTIILFMGDNGTQDEVDSVSGDDKSSVYIGGVHVPMLITDGGALYGDEPCYLDKQFVGTDTPAIVHIADVYQTIIDMVGGQGPTSYTTSSISMLPYMRDTSQDVQFAGWQARPYNFAQFFAPPEIPGRYQKLGECATISDGTYKLNYQNGSYEFSELEYDPDTDLTTERLTNDFQHSQARELWRMLTTPGSPYYAEVDGKGRKFPLLTGITDMPFRYVRLVALSEVNGQPWTSVAEFNLFDHQGRLIDRSGWTVTADSEETAAAANMVANAIDGNPSIMWVTEWAQQSPAHPHELHIDLGTVHKLHGFKYLPRQDGENGRIKDYQLFASADNSKWMLLASGTFPNAAEEQSIIFQPAEPPQYVPSIEPDAMLDMDHFVLHLHGDSYEAGDVWQDTSGRENHATRAEGCTMPVLHQVGNYYGRNFKVMRFHSGGGLILPDRLDLQGPYTVIIVDRYYDMLKGRTLQSRDIPWLVGKWNGENACGMNYWLQSERHIAEDNVFTVQTVTADENNAATWYLNGEQKGYLEGSTPPGKLAFAKAGYFSNEVSEADVAAVLIWTRVLSEQERKSVEKWLALKYGVSIKGVTAYT